MFYRIGNLVIRSPFSIRRPKPGFDLILANLHAATHSELLDHYHRLISGNGGLLIVSGFHDVQSADMEKALAQQGFAVLEKVMVHAWAAATTPEGSFTWVGMGLKRFE